MESDGLKRHSLHRHLFQAAFFALTNGYAQGFAQGRIYTGENKALCVPGLNCYSCPGAYFACPIGSLQAVLNSRSFKVSCYVFGFIMMVGALLGRLVCGFLCPFGLVQDLLYKIPFPRKYKNMPGHSFLRLLRFAVLAVLVILLPALITNEAGTGKPWFCEYVCPSGTLFAGIPLVAVTPALQASIGWRFWLKVAILIVTILLSILYARPFCKYLCPLGALYGACNPISFYRFRVDQDKCVHCGTCQNVCKMDIRVYEDPNSMDCIRCGDCRTACPTQAITTTWQDWSSRFSRDLPAGSAAEEGEEKKDLLRTILGWLVAILGLAVMAVFGLIMILMLLSLIVDHEAGSASLIGLICLYGTIYMDVVAGYIMWKSGLLIARNSGRLSAADRGVRLLVPAAVLLIITRLLANFNSNSFSTLLAGMLWWSLPAVQFILLLSCRHEAGKAPADPEHMDPQPAGPATSGTKENDHS